MSPLGPLIKDSATHTPHTHTVYCGRSFQRNFIYDLLISWANNKATATIITNIAQTNKSFEILRHKLCLATLAILIGNIFKCVACLQIKLANLD